MAFVLVVALAPAIILRATHEPASKRADYYAATDLTKEIRQLRESKPDLLLLGNSMLFTRIDVPTLEKESGLKCQLLTSPGAASAVWYLYLKNIVAPSEVKPKRVVIFFRDRFLTWPQFKTRGIHEPYFKSVQRVFGEPVVDEILGEAARRQLGFRKTIDDAIASTYPSDGSDDRARALFDDLAMDLSSLGAGKRDRRDHMREHFDLSNLRTDVGLDFVENEDAASPPKIDYGWPAPQFAADPALSFLPHMIDVAKEAGLELCFYRVKRRPNETGLRRQDPELEEYIADLQAWIEGQGYSLIDVSNDPEIRLEAYADGDHIAPDQMEWYTRRFWERFQADLELRSHRGATP